VNVGEVKIKTAADSINGSDRPFRLVSNFILSFGFGHRSMAQLLEELRLLRQPIAFATRRFEKPSKQRSQRRLATCAVSVSAVGIGALLCQLPPTVAGRYCALVQYKHRERAELFPPWLTVALPVRVRDHWVSPANSPSVLPP
jgi:hypothetical protein